MIARRLAAFGSSIFAEMTQLAQRHEAVNLSQGFPDFEGPAEIIDEAYRAMRDGHNQYARPLGVPALVEAITERLEEQHALQYDPLTEVCVCCGASEAIAATLLGLLEPGDEVLSFEPFYDSYPAICALAGASFRCVPLRFPDFHVDLDAVAAAIGPRSKVFLLNTPHNPTGRVLNQEELEGIAWLCLEHDLIAVCDEVYEHLFYDDHRHRPLASLPGMRERTLGISSTGKTFSMTGWKIGWAYGPQALIKAVYAAHQFLTFSTATPLQHAMALALRRYDEPWLEGYRHDYTRRRDCLLEILRGAGFELALPEGSYFVLAAHPQLFAFVRQAGEAQAKHEAADLQVARWLTTELRVAVIPPSSFYQQAQADGQRLLRFAFCKRIETLQIAGKHLRKLPGKIAAQ